MSSTTSNALDERQIALLQASSRGLETRVRALLNDAVLWHSRMDQTALRRSLQQVAARGNLSLAKLLIENGADVNPEGNEVGALIKAAATGNVELVRTILYAPEQKIDIDTRDKAGRTALHTAAWGGSIEVVKMILAKHANVDARDREDRTPLIHLAAEKQGRWKIEIAELLLQWGADIEAVDNTKRTALLWVASTGKAELCELLLTGTKAKVANVLLTKAANVAVTNSRGKAALQLAAENNHVSIVAMLLQAGADPNATSDGHWTALHNAAEKGHVDVIKLLLETTSVDVNAETSSGMTALHWSAQNGWKEVVELIIQKPDVMLSNKDTFNSTPLLRAAERGHIDIVNMLSPFQQAHRLPQVAQKACKGFDATIVDFGIEASHKNPEHRKGQLVFKSSVYDVLYGWDSKQDVPLVHTLPKNVKNKPAFRWIHMPANNVAWIETLLTKSFIEGGGARDVDDFKSLEKCFGQEHRGPTVHAHFMRTFCQRMGMSIISGDRHNGGLVDEPGPPAPPLEGHATAGTQKIPEIIEPESPMEVDAVRKPSNAIPIGTPTRADKKKAKKERQQAKEGTPKGDNKTTSGKGRPAKSPAYQLKSEGRANEGRHGKIVLFMPYLHYESDAHRVKMSEVIRDQNNRAFQPLDNTQDTPDENLVEAYLHHSPRLHVRRTLDQFFYHGIDTRDRDQDQVVWRYCKHHNMEQKLFMVDQLWIWILGKDLIITSFPQRWEQPRNDPLNVLDGIIEDINSKTRVPVKSVYDLAMLITGRCSGVFDRHRLGMEEFQFLDMFDASLGLVTERETELFRRFDQAALKAAKWLKHHRKRHRGSSTEDVTSPDSKLEVDFVDALLDIDIETQLLSEVKDIRDELQMINKVLKEQKTIIPDLADRLTEELGGRRTNAASDVHRRSKEQLKIIETHVQDVDRMDKQAEGIYKSLTHLLDLKQKHANAFEARFSRTQAELSARQGQTIMVFTIVTIIFLPLSFMAAFFAINIDEFPHPNGSQGLHLGWVAKYMFGIGLAVAVPLIVVALSVGEITVFFRRLRLAIADLRFLRRRTRNPPSQSPPGTDLAAYPPGRRSQSSYRRRRRSDAYGTAFGRNYEKANGRYDDPEHKGEAVYSTERSLEVGDFPVPERQWTRRTDFSWRRTSPEADRLRSMV